MSGKVVIDLSGVAINALLARLLSLQDMGTYFLTVSLVSIAATFARQGFNQVVVRLVAESIGMGRPGRARDAVVRIFCYTGVGALLVAGLLSLGMGQWLALHAFESPTMAGAIGLVSFLVIVNTYQVLQAETFRGFHDIRLATIFGGLISNLLLMVLFALLWFWQGHSQLKQVLSFVIAAGGGSTILAGILLGRKVSTLKGNSDLTGKYVYAVAAPLLVTNVTFFMLTQADLWILGMFRPQEEVAIYGAAVRLVALVYTPLVIINAVVPPLITEMYTQGERTKLEHVLRSTATLAGIPAFMCVVVLIFVGKSLLAAVYGNVYGGGGIILGVLAIGQLVNVWSGSCGLLLSLTGYHRPAMSIVVFSSLLSVGICLLVVREFGGLGVAVAFSLGLIVQNLASVVYASKRVGVKPHVKFSLKIM